jgi:protein tyrosine/serine phosphatase
VIRQAGSTPTVCFCAAGKGRAGVDSALVLRLVGVLPEAVFDDYVLSRGRGDHPGKG